MNRRISSARSGPIPTGRPIGRERVELRFGGCKPASRATPERAPSPLRLAIVMLAATLSASCLGPGTNETLRYYVLSPVAEGEPALAGTRRMGIMPVRLPGYLDRPALIERRGAEIVPHPFSAWAAPLDQEFARVLAENLQRVKPAYEVAVFPWRRNFTPDQRLVVDVSRFEVENGAALLVARWRLAGANGDGTAPAAESSISVPVAGDDDRARVAALSAALGRLSAEVAAASR